MRHCTSRRRAVSSLSPVSPAARVDRSRRVAVRLSARCQFRVSLPTLRDDRSPQPRAPRRARSERVSPREVGMANLKEGSSGPEVTKLQQRLKDKGFDPGVIDGKVRARNRSGRSIAFQKSEGLASPTASLVRGDSPCWRVKRRLPEDSRRTSPIRRRVRSGGEDVPARSARQHQEALAGASSPRSSSARWATRRWC